MFDSYWFDACSLRIANDLFINSSDPEKILAYFLEIHTSRDNGLEMAIPRDVNFTRFGDDEPEGIFTNLLNNGYLSTTESIEEELK